MYYSSSLARRSGEPLGFLLRMQILQAGRGWKPFLHMKQKLVIDSCFPLSLFRAVYTMQFRVITGLFPWLEDQRGNATLSALNGASNLPRHAVKIIVRCRH